MHKPTDECTDETQAQLIKYVSEELLDGQAVSASDDLLVAGIDSMAVVRLTSFVDETFGIQVPPQDLVIQNFRSIQALSDYLSRRWDSDRE